LLSEPRRAGPPARQSGRIAQLVEQLTLNQRVPGSSPGAPTTLILNDNLSFTEPAKMIILAGFLVRGWRV
jgi:hypothetical protein